MGFPGFGAEPSPRANPLIPQPGPPGTGAPGQFTEFFEQGVPTGQGAPEARTVMDFVELAGGQNSDAGMAILQNFFLFTAGAGDPNSPEDSGPFLTELVRQFNEPPEPTGGVGRTQFPSEAALDFAQAGLANQRAASEAFNRARDKWDLLQATDQLADARRQAATDALTQLLPFMVDPSMQFAPGFEPGGVGPELGNLLGANVPPQRLPTAEVPLSELANPPLAAPPEAISAGVESLL